jgi:hypothetical protein
MKTFTFPSKENMLYCYRSDESEERGKYVRRQNAGYFCQTETCPETEETDCFYAVYFDFGADNMLHSASGLGSRSECPGEGAHGAA